MGCISTNQDEGIRLGGEHLGTMLRGHWSMLLCPVRRFPNAYVFIILRPVVDTALVISHVQCGVMVTRDAIFKGNKFKVRLISTRVLNSCIANEMAPSSYRTHLLNSCIANEMAARK